MIYKHHKKNTKQNDAFLSIFFPKTKAILNTSPMKCTRRKEE